MYSHILYFTALLPIAVRCENLVLSNDVPLTEDLFFGRGTAR